MRPQRFQAFAVDTLKNAPGVVQVATLAEVGDTKYPYGLAVTNGESQSRWQIMGQLADGERHETEERPVEGAPAAWSEAGPSDGPTAWLAAAIGRSECPEIARIEAFQGSASHGVICHFHNGARAYVRKI